MRFCRSVQFSLEVFTLPVGGVYADRSLAFASRFLRGFVACRESSTPHVEVLLVTSPSPDTLLRLFSRGLHQYTFPGLGRPPWGVNIGRVVLWMTTMAFNLVNSPRGRFWWVRCPFTCGFPVALTDRYQYRLFLVVSSLFPCTLWLFVSCIPGFCPP